MMAFSAPTWALNQKWKAVSSEGRDMERLQLALSEIQAALIEHQDGVENDAPMQKRQAEDAKKREAELEVQLEAEHNAHSGRENALLEANARLLARVDELSVTVSKLQTQVVELTRAANQQVIRASGAVGAGANGSPRFAGTATPRIGLPSGSTLLASGSPISSISLSSLPKSPHPVDGGGLLAAIDKSLDTMKSSAAEELERYTDRLKQRSRSVSAAPSNGHKAPFPNVTDSQAVRMAVTPPSAMPERSSNPEPASHGAGTGQEHVLRAHETGEPSQAARRHDAKSSAQPQKAAGPPSSKKSPLASKPITSNSRLFTPTAAAQAKYSISLPSAPPSQKAKPVTVMTTGAGYAARAAAKSFGVASNPSNQATEGSTTAQGNDSSQSGIVTPARPEVRAAPYDDYRMEHRNHESTSAPRVTESYAGDDDEDERASPARRAVDTGLSPPQRTSKPMSAPEFFSLLRAHVPPTGLQRLMAALATHQQGSISRTQLMEVAASVLRPSGPEMKSAGLHPASIDLVSAFDAYLHK